MEDEMKINLLNRGLTVVLIAMLMLGLVGVALASDPAPQSVTWHAAITLYSGESVTAAVTGTAAAKPQDFGIGDCYQIVDATDATTVTGYLQHSPDGTNWSTAYTYPAAITDGVAFTRTAMYGDYTRYWASVATTNPVTITLKCVVKD